MNSDFEEMARIGASDVKARLDARIERERRLQTRAKRVRSTCRYVALIAGLGGIALLFLGSQIHSDAIAGLGCSLFLPTLIAAAILFFMGGLAPTGVRSALTQRERELLDK
ncbi:hypothetical protein ACFL5Q_05495 [Planctomycetota bacterium]